MCYVDAHCIRRPSIPGPHSTPITLYPTPSTHAPQHPPRPQHPRAHTLHTLRTHRTLTARSAYPQHPQHPQYRSCTTWLATFEPFAIAPLHSIVRVHALFWQMIDSGVHLTAATFVCSCVEISTIAPRSAREIEGDHRIEACSCTTRRRVQESALVLQAAARAVAAKWIATLLRANGCTFSLALTALQAAAQALTFVLLGPATWILLACTVAAIVAFGAAHGWPLVPHLLALEACRTRCAQSAGCFPGLVGRADFEPASRQQSGARPSGASQSRPLAMFLIIAGLGSCAANQSAPAPTQGSQPPAAPNLLKAAVPVEMLAGTMDRVPSVGKLPSADVSGIVLHSRHLNQVSVANIAVRQASTLTLHPTLFNLQIPHRSTQLYCRPYIPPQYVSSVSELITAIAKDSVDRVVAQAGTYRLNMSEINTSMSRLCSSAAICIDRTVTIEAAVPGAVVFDAMNKRRVFKIQPGGTAELIGLNITGGSTDSVCSVLGLSTMDYLW